MLISKGADINVKTNKKDYFAKDAGNRTPIHYATYNNMKEMIELLLLKGADINAIDLFY